MIEQPRRPIRAARSDLCSRIFLLGVCLGIWLAPAWGMPEQHPLSIAFSAAQLDGEPSVWEIVQTPQGQMIAAGERLAYYEDHEWRIVPLFRKVAIRSLLVDGNSLWVSSEGELGHFELPLNANSQYRPLDAPGLSTAGDIWDLRMSGGMLVAITQQDVWMVPPRGGESTRTHLPNQARLMAQDWKNRIVIAQQGEGIWEVKAGQLLPLENPLPDSSDTSWHGSDETYVLTSRALYKRGPRGWFPLTSTKAFASQSLITSVVRWGELVVATTFADGLALFDLKTGKMQLTTRAIGLDNASPLCAFVDRSDRLWVGMKKGIAVLESLRFGHWWETPALPVLAGRHGGLLISYNDHAEFWLDDGRAVRIPERAWSITSTRSGPLIGLWGKVHVDDQTIDTPGNMVLSSVELPDGDLIVNSGERAYRVKPSLGTAQEITKPSTVFSGMAVLGDTLWAAGSNGNLYRATLGDSLVFERAATFPHRGEPVIKNLAGTLVFTSTNGVLYGENFLQAKYTERLRAARLADNADGLWLVGEQDGVHRLGKLVWDGAEVTWKTVEAKGLAQCTEIRSMHGHGHALILCGDSKVLELNTDQLKPVYQLDPPQLSFIYHDPRTGLTVTNVSPPTELTVEESGLSFSGTLPFDEFGERPRYERRLRPSEATWLTTKMGETVSYPSLSPRRYILEVRATHLGRTGPVTAHAFTVLPPWYATVPAAAGYVVIAALGFHGLYRLRTHNLRRRTAELERIVQERTQALAEASAAKTEFLASMSHEIRNPMNGVIGLVEILREQPASPRQEHTLKLLHHCADQLRTTVDDILDFSKIEAGRIELENVDFDLRDTLEAAATTVDPSGKQIHFVDPLPSGIRLVGDLGKLRQIFANYLNNALKYGVPPGARVSTLLTNTGGKVRLTLGVASSGPTIPKETLDRFFDSFTRGSEAIDRNIRGTGLGLAICRKYAQAMGGEVGAVSANGETTFYLNVPFARADAEVPAATAPAPHAALPAKALAIEDEDYNRLVLGSILAKMNYTVDWATTGEEALRLAQENGYDVIFTDYRLPDTNGVELTKKILALCADPTPAVFAVTAYSTKERRDECLNAGMSGFISKPITLEKLRTTLAAWGEHRLATISLETSQPPAPATATALKASAEVVTAWEELEHTARTDPKRAAELAHRLNNTCRAHGLVDVAEQLELLEGALERGEPVEPFLRACEQFLCATATAPPS